MLDAIVAGLLALVTPQSLLFMVLGVLYGLVIGILPGLGGGVAMALVPPFTYGFDHAATGALLGGLFGAVCLAVSNWRKFVIVDRGSSGPRVTISSTEQPLAPPAPCPVLLGRARALRRYTRQRCPFSYKRCC